VGVWVCIQNRKLQNSLRCVRKTKKVKKTQINYFKKLQNLRNFPQIFSRNKRVFLKRSQNHMNKLATTTWPKRTREKAGKLVL
jgi:hypothetical protein